MMNQHVVTLTLDRRGSPGIQKEQLATLFERLAGKDLAQRLLRSLGLNPRQFVLFLGLLRTLSEREQLMGSIGVSRFNISYLALWAAGIRVFPWSLIVAYQVLPAPIYLLIDLSLTFSLTYLVFIREAANSLFNPVEASMLAHKPVHGATYAAAKIVHIVIAVLYLVLGLNVYPALIGFGLHGARWFWLITHLGSAFLVGLWTAFIICAFYGWMRRLAPASLLKSISMWIQVLSFGAFIIIPIFFSKMFFNSFLGGLLTARFENSQWTWLPLTWFAEIGRMGCHGTSWQLGWQGALSITASIAIIWFGLRSFSGTYLLEATSARTQDRSWRNQERGAISRWSTAVVHAVTGSPLGLGAYCFVSKMIRRDWLFRRAILTQTWIPLLVVLGIVLSLARSGNPSSASTLPHLLGLVSLALCINLPFTVFSQGSWIYLTAPIESARAFARGIFWALWVPAAGLPQIVLLLLLPRFSDWQNAVFVAGFNLMIASLYLSFEIRLISGLPFSCPVNESRAMINGIYIQICGLMAIAIPLMVQDALCERFLIALVSAIALFPIIRIVLRINLEKLEKEILWRLYIMKMGPDQIFREIE
jgi:hypothetical protein